MSAPTTSYVRPRVAATPARHVAISSSSSPRKEEVVQVGLAEGSDSTHSDRQGVHLDQVVATRWTPEQTREATRASPPFRYPALTDDQLDKLCAAYTAITGDPVRRHLVQRFDKKANYLAACWRTHGPDTLELIRLIFNSTGTTLNLLGKVRGHPYRDTATVAVGASASDDVTDGDETGIDVIDDAWEPSPEDLDFERKWQEMDGWGGLLR